MCHEICSYKLDFVSEVGNRLDTEWNITACMLLNMFMCAFSLGCQKIVFLTIQLVAEFLWSTSRILVILQYSPLHSYLGAWDIEHNGTYYQSTVFFWA